MRVLGIDPGSNIMGFGLVEKNNQEISLILSGIIKTKAKTHSQKLKQLFDGLMEILNTHTADFMLIESPFLGKNVNSLIKLSQARAIPLLVAEIKSIPIAEMSPREIKQLVVGTGACEKEDVRRMVGHHLKVNSSDMSYDSSDAVGGALAFLFKKH